MTKLFPKSAEQMIRETIERGENNSAPAELEPLREIELLRLRLSMARSTEEKVRLLQEIEAKQNEAMQCIGGFSKSFR